MRYMIHDPALGFIVKDPERGEQCEYRGRQSACIALQDGIGKSGYETTHREALVHVSVVELREHVLILREALEKARSGLSAAACYFDKQDDPVVANQVEEALEESRAALDATKEP